MGFSASQLRALRRDVDQRNLRSRQVESGRMLTYIEGWHSIAEANRIFGFDGWDRETLESRCVLAKEIRGTFTAIYIARVRITVRADGETIIREGQGTGENHGTHPGEAHDRAIKAAETDATKRALVTFGKPFGLSLYLSKRSAERKRRSVSDQPIITRNVALPLASLASVSEPGSPQTQVPDTGRRRTRQRLGSDGRYYVPARTEPTSDSFHAILAKEHAKNGSASSGSRPTVPSDQAGAASNTVVSNDARNDDTVRTSLAAQTAFLIAHPRRARDKDHLIFVAKQPCLLCGRTPADAHHLRFAQPRAMSRKVSDEFTVPLCRTHHRQLHHAGDEIAWWNDLGVDPLPIAQEFWQQSRERAEPDAPRLDGDGQASHTPRDGKSSLSDHPSSSPPTAAALPAPSKAKPSL